MSTQNEAELYTGQISIKLFSLFGLWRPLNWKSEWKIWLYCIYSIFMLTYYSTFTFSLLMYFTVTLKDTDSFILNLYYFMAIFNILIKQISILVKRKVIINLREKLLDTLCQPRDLYELEKLHERSQVCRSNGIFFLILFNVTAAVAILSPLTKGKNVTLPFSGWYPYNLESRALFSLTYIFQTFALIISTCTSASVEGLALAIILQMCAQLEIIFHRLQLLPNLWQKHKSHSKIYQLETRLIADCIKHHIHIYLLGQQLNRLFGLVIFVQFFSSMISLCVIIYQLSRLSFYNTTYWFLVACTGSVTAQIFLYCFYGEQIIQMSMAVTNAVQEMDWTPLTNRGRKDLLIMMTRATRPIQLTGSSVVVMSIKTFVKIVKSAYSAYNLLKNSF